MCFISDIYCYSDNDEDYGDEGRVYRVMCREGIIEE
jgi:hypothetical protein